MPSHAGFIIAAYAVTAVILLIMTTAVMLDGRAQRRALDRLGADRRGAGETS